MPITKSTLFMVNKDEWDTKEDTGKSMKNALHVQRYGKRHLCTAEATSNSEKIKPVALSYARMKASVSQAVR